MTVFNKMLGIEIFTEDGKQDREIKTRCQKSNNVSDFLNWSTTISSSRQNHHRHNIHSNPEVSGPDVDNHQEN